MRAASALLLFAAPLAAAPLPLREALRETLSASPEVAQARETLAASRLEEPGLLANLDPVFKADAGHRNDGAPRTNPAFQGTFSRADSWGAGIVQNTLLGTEARLFFDNLRVRSPAAFRPLDPTVESTLGLEVSQPLLRYFWGRPDVARRSRARAGVRAAEGRLRQTATEAAAAAGRAWLELADARAQAVVREGGVSDARRLLSKHEEKRRYGLVEESDLLQARVSLEAQETELLLARSRIETASNALLSALRRLTAEGAHAPELGPEVDLPPPPTLEEAIRAGLERRGDLASATAAAEAAEWALRVERLDTLPDLRVSGSIAYGGLGGGWASARDDLDGFDHRTAAAGVSLAVPFGFRRERLARQGAAARHRSAVQEQERARQSALREMRNAWEGVALARLRLDASRRLEELERRKLAEEDKNYQRGRSSTDLLVRFQGDLRRAESALLRARTDESLARLELLRATGTLLETLGLEMAP